MYDRDRVDFSPTEHSQAEKLDNGIEGVIKALDDGFQPLQDVDDIARVGWAVADVVRTSSRDFFDKNGRSPRPAEISAIVATYFLMLERDNRYSANV